MLDSILPYANCTCWISEAFKQGSYLTEIKLLNYLHIGQQHHSCDKFTGFGLDIEMASIGGLVFSGIEKGTAILNV